MSFFQQLFNVSEQLSLTIQVKRKNDKLTIAVFPDGVKNITPLTVTATPAELDEKFFEIATEPLREAGELQTNAEQFAQSVKSEANKQKTKKEDKAAATAKKNATSNKPKHKSKAVPAGKAVTDDEITDGGVSTTEPVEEKPAGPKAVSMF